jgi:long-chain-acyl-CoA dehydrogenase
MVTTTEVMWAYVDRALLAYKDSKLTAEDAAKVKFWATEREWEVLDMGVQLHGGYGYITEFPIAKAYVDARVQRIYGGTNEIQRLIIGRDLTGFR